MHDDFVIARNPEADSALPYLLRIPLPGRPVVLKSRETWPRTSKVYCHRAEGWPAEAEVVERVPVLSCSTRGPSLDLVLDRGRENRSQFVFTRLKTGREAIFWQTSRTSKSARPGVRMPTARASGVTTMEVVVDRRERYAYSFSTQQATVVKGSLPCGDYGVRQDGKWLAVVERKSLQDLAASLVSGRFGEQVAQLATVPHAAVVIEDRWSRVFALEHVQPSFVADLLARVQVRWPQVPVFFAETRPLAQEWTFRFLGAALSESVGESRTASRLAGLVPAPPLAPAEPTAAALRTWAVSQGFTLSSKGRIPREVRDAYARAHMVASVPPEAEHRQVRQRAEESASGTLPL